jgi:CrcB protein
MNVILVFLGGGCGAALRFGVHAIFKHWGWIERFPWHTFAINVLGSFLLGVFVATCKDRPLFLLLGTGLCGGFTTFSTFSYETIQMFEDGRWLVAAAYVLGSVAVALVGVAIGYWMMR